MHFFGMEASSVQLRVGAPVLRPCASTAVEPALRQVSYARCAQGSTGDCDQPSLSELRLGGPFTPPCGSLWISFVKKSCRGSTGWRLHFEYFSGEWLRGNRRPRRSRVCEPWRCKSSLAHHFLEPKPQQTGTRLLIGYGEVATTSGSTTFGVD